MLNTNKIQVKCLSLDFKSIPLRLHFLFSWSPYIWTGHGWGSTSLILLHYPVYRWKCSHRIKQYAEKYKWNKNLLVTFIVCPHRSFKFTQKFIKYSYLTILTWIVSFSYYGHHNVCWDCGMCLISLKNTKMSIPLQSIPLLFTSTPLL